MYLDTMNWYNIAFFWVIRTGITFNLKNNACDMHNACKMDMGEKEKGGKLEF